MKKQISQTMLAGSLAVGLLMVSSPGWADDTTQLREQVQSLQNQVNQLETQLENRPQAGVWAPAMPVYDQWDPFTQMMLTREQMDRSMGEDFAPRMDIKKTDKEYLITVDIPGMDKNKINVETKDGMLVISGERKSETTQDNKGNQYYRQERSFGSFLQEIPLPEDARADQIGAKYTNGVLTVTVARMNKEEKRPGNQKITVQ